MKIRNLSRNCYIVEKGWEVKSWRGRLKGLIGHPPLQRGEGLIIRSCNWIHTFVMSFPIDVLYVDDQGQVVNLGQSMVPNRFGSPVWKASFVIELPAGTITSTGTAIGDQLDIEQTLA
ncbi:MAG: DUF192 domain-containing protein [Anaerolineae bacterium]